MSQMPPPATPFPPPGGFQPMPGPPRTNGLSIGSLICGIVGCMQLTAIVAIILGILGIKKSREPNTGGKGMAIAGIVLGILWLILGVGIGGTSYWGWQKAKQMVIDPPNMFITSLQNNDVATARKFTTEDFSVEKITKLSGEIKTYGKFQNLAMTKFDSMPTDGKSMGFIIGGTAKFDSATKQFVAVVVGDPSNPSSFRLKDFQLE